MSRKITKKMLQTSKRNREKLARAIRASPRAPPQTGLLGRAFNVVRRNPEPFIDASSYAFSPRLALEGQDRLLRMLEEGREAKASTIIREQLMEATPSLDEVEALIASAGDEEFLNQELVDSLLAEIETGRDVIRRSNQFRRDLILPDLPENLVITRSQPKRTRKKTKTDKNMSKALRMSNERFRTKKGKLRKGATQAQIMKYAHKLLKKM